MRHFLAQFKWYRKYKGGEWVLVNTHLDMPMYWCELSKFPKCCGSHTMQYENYGFKPNHE